MIVPPDDKIPEPARAALLAVHRLQVTWHRADALAKQQQKNPNRNFPVSKARDAYDVGLGVLCQVLAVCGLDVMAGDLPSPQLAGEFMEEWWKRRSAEQVSDGPAQS